jgi:hypothetical protein
MEISMKARTLNTRSFTALVLAWATFVTACSGEDEEEEPTGPEGVVSECFGDCPFGECGSPITEDCAPLYPDPIDSSSDYCAPNADGEYCIVIDEGSSRDYWVIVCENGTPTFDHCGSGCSANSTPTGSDASCE